MLIIATIRLRIIVGAAREGGQQAGGTASAGGKGSDSHGAGCGARPGLQIDSDVTGGLSKSCKGKIPGGIALLLLSFGKLIIPINI